MLMLSDEELEQLRRSVAMTPHGQATALTARQAIDIIEELQRLRAEVER